MRFVMLLSLSLVASSFSVARAVDFEKEIKPIFIAKCSGCHGEEKGQARLRLHTAEAVKESLTKHDDLIVKGNVDESELYARLVLPEDNRKRMPKNADPLPKEEIELIKKWLEEGAKLGEAEAKPEAKADAKPEMTEAAPKKELPPLEITAANPQTIAEVQKLGALVLPLYSKSPALRVSFPSSPDKVSDETVAALVPLAPQTVELDLSGTKITDASAENLAKFINVERVHLEKTEVGNATVAALASLPRLKYLNLHSSKIDDKALEMLMATPTLDKLYVWKTPVEYDTAKALEKAIPGLAVNLGWDHPGVVRERLTAELAQVEKRKAEATKAIEEAEAKLKQAQADQKEATEREAEIKKQLGDAGEKAEEKPEEGKADKEA